METKNITLTALIADAKYRDLNDPEQIAKVVEKIGPLDRDTYIATLVAWKAEYKAISQIQRDLKPKRKGGTLDAGRAITDHRSGRDTARAYMLLRAALKQVARNHHAELKKAA